MSSTAKKTPAKGPAGKTLRGSAVGGKRRHGRAILRGNLESVGTKPALRRLARRGGVKRVDGDVYAEMRGALHGFLVPIIGHAVTYAEHARRKTIQCMDVVYALKRRGRELYGYDAKSNKK